MIQRIFIAIGILLIFFLGSSLLSSKATIEGKWRWAYSRHVEGTEFTKESLKHQRIHEYHADGTYTIWENSKPLPGKHTYTLRQSLHPDGSGEQVTFIATNDGNFTEESLVWLQGAANDTLLFVALDPSHRAYLYSVYTQVKQ